MDFTKLIGLDEAITTMPGVKKVGFGKDGLKEVPFYQFLSTESEFPEKAVEKGELSLGTENNGKQGVAENVNSGEGECFGATGNCGLGGVCGIGIGLELRRDLRNDWNENCRRNVGFGIAQNYEKKEIRRAKVNMENPYWSRQETGLSGCRKLMPKSNLIGRMSLGNPPGQGGIGSNVPESEIQMPAWNSLKEILFFSGWMLKSQGGSSSGAYFSPSGSSYESLPQALDAFSQGTSMFRVPEWSLSPLIGNEEQKRNSVSLSSDLCSNVGKFGGDVKDVQKKRRGPWKRTRTSTRLTLSAEDMLLSRKEELDKDMSVEGMISGELHDNMIRDECLSCETEESDCYIVGVREIDQSSESEMHQGLRRSARIHGKHVPVDCEFDIERVGCGDYIGRETANFSRKEVINIDCSSSDLHNVDELLKVRKPKETNDNCFALSSLVPEEMGCRVAHHLAAASCLVNEKAKSCNNNECSSYENKKLDFCGGEVETHNSSNGEMEVGANLDCYEMEAVKIKRNCKRNMCQQGNSLGLRRSARISGKRVPVDSELNIEMAPRGDCLHSLECTVNKAAVDTMEIPINSIIETEKMDSESRRSGKILVKQITGKRFDSQKEGNQKQLETNGNPVSVKCSPLLKKSGTTTLVSEKCSPSSTSKRKVVRRGNSHGKRKRKRSGGCGLTIRRPVKGEYQENVSSETKATMLSWLIDACKLTENENVVYRRNCNSILKGRLTRGGIWCSCCKKVVSLLEFEAHASSDLRQPWENAWLSSGKSLMQCWSEAWEKEKEKRKVGFQIVGTNDPDSSDDTCGVCADGGSLICCDKCPSTFHQDCLMLKSLPEGNWYCPNCRCAFCTEQGGDTITASFKLFSCNQCRRRYHRECGWGHEILVMGSDSTLFCGNNCKKIAARLSGILGVSNPIGGGYSWTLLRRLDEDRGISSDKMPSFIVECNIKLSLALSVLDECFDHLVDPRTGLDMISQAIYNCRSNYNRLNYERFHTVILEKDNEIISAATLRIHGTHLAEMPFIGTRPTYQRQGMCGRLLEVIEEFLSSLHVEKLIIPAIPDLLETWMTSFSFKPLELSHKKEIRNLSMMVFADTTLLQKPICNTEMKDEQGAHIIPGSQDGPLMLSP